MRLARLGLILVALTSTIVSARDSDARGSALAYYQGPRTLSAVAKRFHLSVAEIASLNGIKDPDRFHAHGVVLPDTPHTRALPRYVPWPSAPPRQVCASTSWSFHPAVQQGCVEAYCASGPSGAKACLCKDNRGGERLDLVEAGKAAVRIPIETSVWNPWGSSVVDVTSVDLDSDGKSETLVSWLMSVGNGLGAESRTLVLLKDGRELLRYDSGEVSSRDAAVSVDGSCHLGSMHYEDATHPLRGPGLYHVERTFDPIRLRMAPTLVGQRVGDNERYVLPFDPLLQGATSDGRRRDRQSGRVFPPDLMLHAGPARL